MVAYKKMYLLLCAAVSDSLDILSHNGENETIMRARELLHQALIKAEQIYVDTENEDNEND